MCDHHNCYSSVSYQLSLIDGVEYCIMELDGSKIQVAPGRLQLVQEFINTNDLLTQKKSLRVGAAAPMVEQPWSTKYR